MALTKKLFPKQIKKHYTDLRLLEVTESYFKANYNWCLNHVPKVYSKTKYQASPFAMPKYKYTILSGRGTVSFHMQLIVVYI